MFTSPIVRKAFAECQRLDWRATAADLRVTCVLETRKSADAFARSIIERAASQPTPEA